MSKANTFCKLYETETGQILVKLDTHEDGRPEVRYYTETDTGVCSFAAIYPDTDEGRERAARTFGGVTRESATAALRPVFVLVGEA